MTLPIPQDNLLLPTGRISQSWQRFFSSITTNLSGGITSISIVPANGFSGTVGGTTSARAITLSLGDATVSSVASSGPVTASNLSGTNTGDETSASIKSKLGVTSVTFPTSGTLATVGGTMAAGGAVTQTVSKIASVTLNAATGRITTSNASLAANAVASFTLANSVIAATDIVLSQLVSGTAIAGAYQVWTESVTAGSVVINVRNISGGSLSEALLIGFAVVKSVTA